MISKSPLGCVAVNQLPMPVSILSFMSITISTRLPAEQDIASLAANLRQSDRDELLAVCDLPPYSAVMESVRRSDPDFLCAAFADGQLLCIAGATPTVADARIAAPWLLATDLMDRYRLSLSRDARRGVSRMLEKYPILCNVIDVRQAGTIRWLETLGFKMVECIEKKPGFPLFRFELRRF